jgi:hypothetical protein
MTALLLGPQNMEGLLGLPLPYTKSIGCKSHCVLREGSSSLFHERRTDFIAYRHKILEKYVISLLFHRKIFMYIRCPLNTLGNFSKCFMCRVKPQGRRGRGAFIPKIRCLG